jgi:uncharacterized protein
MSEQRNLQLVHEFYAAFERGGIIGVLNTLADDMSWFIPGPKDIILFVGQRQGREQVAQFIAELAETQDAQQFEPREFVAQGDKVVALGHYRWRIESTGHSYASDWYMYSPFTTAKSRSLRSIWTPRHGQPHIAVLNPLPAGLFLSTQRRARNLKDRSSRCGRK